MRLPLTAAIVLTAVPALAATDKAMDRALDAAIAGPQRSEPNRARDVYRHPKATLEFCGLKSGDTVVEVSPSAGWYTEILAPALKGRGVYYAAHSNPAASAGAAKGVAAFKAKLASDPGYAEARPIPVVAGDYAVAPGPGVADLVLTFRNVHNWYIGGYAPQMFASFYRALKPGGTLCLEEHRLPEARADADMKSSGYMKVSMVKSLAAGAGFKFVAASEVNANPNDKADYPKGVWTLPPTYQEGDKDRARYAAIGESDRMTLKFVKPR